MLMPDYKVQSVQICANLLEWYETMGDFLDTVVTQDWETWVLLTVSVSVHSRVRYCTVNELIPCGMIWYHNFQNWDLCLTLGKQEIEGSWSMIAKQHTKLHTFQNQVVVRNAFYEGLHILCSNLASAASLLHLKPMNSQLRTGTVCYWPMHSVWVGRLGKQDSERKHL
jgi:hypothetical protein